MTKIDILNIDQADPDIVNISLMYLYFNQH